MLDVDCIFTTSYSHYYHRRFSIENFFVVVVEVSVLLNKLFNTDMLFHIFMCTCVYAECYSNERSRIVAKNLKKCNIFA